MERDKEISEIWKNHNIDEIIERYYELEQEVQILEEKLQKNHQFDKCRMKELIDFKERTHKAIEYIENVKDTYTISEIVNPLGITTPFISVESWKIELLEILKGDNSE